MTIFLPNVAHPPPWFAVNLPQRPVSLSKSAVGGPEGGGRARGELLGGEWGAVREGCFRGARRRNSGQAVHGSESVVETLSRARWEGVTKDRPAVTSPGSPATWGVPERSQGTLGRNERTSLGEVPQA